MFVPYRFRGPAVAKIKSEQNKESPMSAPTPINISLANVEPTWSHALRVWWSWQWRTLLFGLILSVITMPIGMVVGIVFGATGIGHVIAQIMGFLTFAFVGIYVMK